MKRTLLSSIFAAAVLVAPAHADVIMDWNSKADAIARSVRTEGSRRPVSKSERDARFTWAST